MIEMTLAGLLCVICGVVGMIRGEKVVDTKGGTVARFLSMPRGWAKYLKWPMGLGLVMMGLLLIGLGITNWGRVGS